MSAARKLLDHAAEFGAKVYINAGKVRVEAQSPLPDELVASLRELKDEIAQILAPPPPVFDLDERRVRVDGLLANMATENEPRRDWHTKPVEGWREGTLPIRSAVTGEAVVVKFLRRS